MAARQFPTEISKKLGLYVYRLVDPRSGETFYVGRVNRTGYSGDSPARERGWNHGQERSGTHVVS